MPKIVQVCHAGDCSGKGGGVYLLRDIEELLGNSPANAEHSACLGKCGRGPNVQINSDGAKSSKGGIKDFKKITALVEEMGASVSSDEKKVAKLKYDARRSLDPAQRMQKIQEAFSILGGEQAACNPSSKYATQAAFLLTMRAKDLMKNDTSGAVRDARLAVKLHPAYAFGYSILATVLEPASRYVEASQAIKTAIEIGSGLEMSTIKRLQTRIDKKLVENPTDPPEEEIAKAPEVKKEEVKAAPKPTVKKAAPKGQGAKKDVKPKDKKVEKEEKPVDPKDMVIPEFVEWNIDSVTQLNADCFVYELRHNNKVLCAEQCARAAAERPIDAWHINLRVEPEPLDEIVRSYTPASTIEEYKEGKLTLMIKIYEKGRIGQYLAKTQQIPGPILVSAPHTTVDTSPYLGCVWVAGGSAVTIVLQHAALILQAKPFARIHVFMCNRTKEDLVYAERFEELLEKYPLLAVTHVLSRGAAPSDYKGKAAWSTGRLSHELLGTTEAHLKGCVSGPEGLSATVYKSWKKLGRDVENLDFLDGLPDMEEEPAPFDAAAADLKAAAGWVDFKNVYQNVSTEVVDGPVKTQPLFLGLFPMCHY